MRRSRLARAALVSAVFLVLGGCVYYGPPDPYAGYGYPGYAYSPGYYGPPVYGSVGIGLGFGGWHDHDWHDRDWRGGWRRDWR